MKNKHPQLSISLIGAGNLGKSLAWLWRDSGLLSIKQIFTTSAQSAQAAVEFIGAGAAHIQLTEMELTDILLIAVPDDQIDAICAALITLTIDLENTIVFHCSGVLSSTTINSLRDKGASIASIHPIKSFADPKTAVTSFNGTFCGMEGDTAALDVLAPLFTKLGANCLNIDPDKKVLYHCAAVFANNYMVSLIECAQQLYKQSGIERDQSMQLLAPILRETCENLIALGTQQSLTGPVARGDQQTIEKHLAALELTNPETLSLYKSLGNVALSLSENSQNREIQKLLS